MFTNVFSQIAASVFLHGCIVGLVLAFSSGGLGPDEQVYHVTLAEFASAAPPAAPASPPPSPQPDPPGPEPVVEAPRPEPVVEKPPKPKTKKINTKKMPEKAKSAEETKPAPAPVAAAAEPFVPAGPAHNIGGFAAYDADAVDQRPAIARRVLPEYPQKARRLNKEGKVFVRAVVDTAGHPRECTIYTADPAGFFEESALAAARKTRFIPGKVGGKAVNTVVLIPFVFALR